MNTVWLLIAAGAPGRLFVNDKFWDGPTREGLIILGALGLVTLAILIWTLFIRKPHRRHHSHHHHHSHEWGKNPGAEKEAEGGEGSSKRRKWRRQRRPHRPRNPTLAETGGLPPVRSEPPPGL
jgi:hypothetical protein